MNITSFLRTSAQPTVDLIGRVDKVINGYEPGRVCFQGVYWPAKLKQPNYPGLLLPGTKVRVLGRENLTLLVAPIQNSTKYIRERQAQIQHYLPISGPIASVN